jgi:predicted MFS family arabinose efflux permease
MDFMVMMPLGPQIMRAFQITPAAFATAVSAYSWCAGVSGLLAATYIDRFDRRRLLLVVYALFAASNLACAGADSYPLLLAARAFSGMTGGVLGSVVMAIVSDVVPAARRGAATGVIMTAFSLAAIAGVPAGVLLGAHYGWAAPFMLLVVLSVLVWLASGRVVPALDAHRSARPAALASVLPELWRVLTQPRHLTAFALTFVMMTSHMLVIPFISPMLVANHGVTPGQLSWLYMAGGAATFLSSRAIGRLEDRYGKHRIFCVMTLLSVLPVLSITHLPDLPFVAMVLFFPLFMVTMSGRSVPMQALLTTVPEPASRGAFPPLRRTPARWEKFITASHIKKASIRCQTCIFNKDTAYLKSRHLFQRQEHLLLYSSNYRGLRRHDPYTWRAARALVSYLRAWPVHVYLGTDGGLDESRARCSAGHIRKRRTWSCGRAIHFANRTRYAPKS